MQDLKAIPWEEKKKRQNYVADIIRYWIPLNIIVLPLWFSLVCKKKKELFLCTFLDKDLKTDTLGNVTTYTAWPRYRRALFKFYWN